MATLSKNKQVVTQGWLKTQMSDSSSELYLQNENVSKFTDLNRGITAEEIKNSTFVTYSADSSEYGLHLRNYEYSNSGNTPYADNQYVIKEDLFATNKVIDYNNSTLTAGDMDPMGGVSQLVFNVYSNVGSEQVDLTQEDNFNTYGQYLKIGSEKAELLNIQGTNKVVFSNNINATKYDKSKRIDLVINGSTISESVNQTTDDLGVFTKGRGTITDGKLNSKLCSNLTDANWKSGGTHFTFGGGIKNVAEADGGDWYITDDILYERGTVLQRNVVSDQLQKSTGVTLSSVYSGKYHISWDKDQASNKWIFLKDSTDLSTECPDTYTGARSKYYYVTYKCYYRQVTHNYGKTAILYAESYPEKFKSQGLPYIYEFEETDSDGKDGFDLNQDSKPDKKYFSNTQYTNPTLVYLSVGTQLQINTSNSNFSITYAKGATATQYPDFSLNSGNDGNSWYGAIFWLDPENCYKEDGVIYLKADDAKTYTDDWKTNVHYMREIHTSDYYVYTRRYQSIYGEDGNDSNVSCSSFNWPAAYLDIYCYYTPLYSTKYGTDSDLDREQLVKDTYGLGSSYSPLSNDKVAKSFQSLAKECGNTLTLGDETASQYTYCSIGDTICGQTATEQGWYEVSIVDNAWKVKFLMPSQYIWVSGYASILGSKVTMHYTSTEVPTLTYTGNMMDGQVIADPSTSSCTFTTNTSSLVMPPEITVTFTCGNDSISEPIGAENSTGLSYQVLAITFADKFLAK